MRRRDAVLVLACVAGAAGLPGCGPRAGTAARPAPATHIVTIDASRFQPQALTVKAGDSVVWVNKDMFPHTATAADRLFDSDSIESGGSWTYIPADTGTLAYTCTFHPAMKGTLRVE